jgi:hypothetical protein
MGNGVTHCAGSARGSGRSVRARPSSKLEERQRPRTTLLPSQVLFCQPALHRSTLATVGRCQEEESGRTEEALMCHNSNRTISADICAQRGATNLRVSAMGSLMRAYVPTKRTQDGASELDRAPRAAGGNLSTTCSGATRSSAPSGPPPPVASPWQSIEDQPGSRRTAAASDHRTVLVDIADA